MHHESHTLWHLNHNLMEEILLVLLLLYYFYKNCANTILFHFAYPNSFLLLFVWNSDIWVVRLSGFFLNSFIDLPSLSSSIYSTELCTRLRAFLIACPPTGPSPPVAELVIATADFQRDLSNWNIKYVIFVLASSHCWQNIKGKTE